MFGYLQIYVMRLKLLTEGPFIRLLRQKFIAGIDTDFSKLNIYLQNADIDELETFALDVVQMTNEKLAEIANEIKDHWSYRGHEVPDEPDETIIAIAYHGVQFLPSPKLQAWIEWLLDKPLDKSMKIELSNANDKLMVASGQKAT